VLQVLQELGADSQLERFRLEYETLYRALKKSHESEKRLVKKCRELVTDITGTKNKTENAVKLSAEDQTMIAQLRTDIVRTSTAVETSLLKEKDTKEELEQLRIEIEELRQEVKAGAGSSVAQENRLRDLITTKDETAREAAAAAHHVTQLRAEIMDLTERLKLVDAEKLKSDGEVAELKREIDEKRAATDKERRRKEAAEAKLKELKAVLEQRAAELRQKQELVVKGASYEGKLETELREQKQTTDRALKEMDAYVGKVAKLSDELKEQVTRNASVASECRVKVADIASKNEENAALQVETKRICDLKDKLQKRIDQLEAQTAETNASLHKLTQEIAMMDVEITKEKRERETERKQTDDLSREREILNKNLVKAQVGTTLQVDLIRTQENTKANLEVEIAGYRTTAGDLGRQIKKLTAEKDKYSAEAQDAADRYAQALDAVKEREINVLQLQKKIAEGEAKLKQQQNLYEAVRSDRNLYAKNLIESQDEIAEMKRKFKVMTRQIEQLKDEIQTKDTSLVREHFEKMKVVQDRESLRELLNNTLKKEEDMAREEKLFKAEVAKLNQIINEAEAERSKQQKEFEVVVNERDILGTQLIRRNDELSALYEKIKLQQCTLAQGERAYEERLGDQQALLKDVQLLRSELFALKSSILNLEALRNETFALNRELLHERTKVRALSEELENQMNVHRWRKLEGSDPATYAMIQRAHKLQKTLIKKTEEVAVKDALIQQKEKLYVELRAILARQPGPEVAEQLNLYQANLAEKTKQLKSMSSELILHRQQCNDLKIDQEALAGKIAQLKKRFVAQRLKMRTQAQGGGGYGGMPSGMPSGGGGGGGGGGIAGGIAGGVPGYEGAGSYDLSDFTAAPGTADFGDFLPHAPDGPGGPDDGPDGAS